MAECSTARRLADISVLWVVLDVADDRHHPHSRYVEQWWLPLLGPTATWALRRLADWGGTPALPTRLDLPQLAAAVGVKPSTGANSPVVRSLARLVDFAAVNLHEDTVTVTGLLDVRESLRQRLSPALMSTFDERG